MRDLPTELCTALAKAAGTPLEVRDPETGERFVILTAAAHDELWDEARIGRLMDAEFEEFASAAEQWVAEGHAEGVDSVRGWRGSLSGEPAGGTEADV